MLFPWGVIAFEQPARPHTPASRLRAPHPHKSGALFLWLRSALSSDRQHHAKNNESDNHGRAQHPQLKFGEHWQSPTPKSVSIQDVHFHAKSSENAEELGNSPSALWEAVHEVN